MIRNIIKNVINEYIERKINENAMTMTLYHCYNGDLFNNDFIWLSETPDNIYGEKTATFSIPLNNLRLADKETTIDFIKTYDIRTFQDALDDEFASMGLEYFNWKAYRDGKISDEKAYESIPYLSWAEVMEHPEYYNFIDKMKESGFDGYYFDYIDNGTDTYFLIFDAKKIQQYQI